MKSDLGFLIVTHNSADKVGRCLNSIRLADPDAPIVIVDNASADGTASVVSRHIDPPPDVHAMPVNVGLCAGLNIGLRSATWPLVAIVNPDARIWPQFPTAIRDAFAHHRHAGAVYPGIVDSHSGRIDRGAVLDSDLKLRRTSCAHPRRLNGIGACVVYRRAALVEIGGFDPRLWMFQEETDVALRLRGQGWATVFIEDVLAEHDGAHSYDRNRGQYSARYNANAFRVALKHYPASLILRSLPRFVRSCARDLASHRWSAGDVWAAARIWGALLRDTPVLLVHRRSAATTRRAIRGNMR